MKVASYVAKLVFVCYANEKILHTSSRTALSKCDADSTIRGISNQSNHTELKVFRIISHFYPRINWILRSYQLPQESSTSQLIGNNFPSPDGTKPGPSHSVRTYEYILPSRTFLFQTHSQTTSNATMSSSSRSAGTNLIGLFRNNNNSFEDDLQSESPERRAPRRSSLDSLHALAEFLPDDLLCDQQDGNVAATTFGFSDPLLNMPLMTIDVDNPSNYNTSTTEDEYFESTLSEPTNYTSTIPSRSRSRAQKDKPKRRASTDAFVNFHRMMGTSSSANAFDIMPTPGMSSATPSTRHDSISSFTTACESISSTTATSTNHPNQLNIPKSFAESMLKSSQSREQLDYMQRQVVLQQQQQGGSAAVPTTPSVTSATTLASPSTPQKRRQLNPETVTLTAQFLSGKRPTLTAALEESRKQLKAHQDKLGCGTY